uniref:NitT/TauT family transport system permease protein n=1 Tax=Candidatus Kentrum sp. SD TaxID=2126332 RepID=A0A451BHV1_9GAMM|nr:MAG: NitT/TauT family transport system permease protein [Candidatus Kentron sp. SD]VFK39237.1 MAG: NitT/TauT family transport system permease protein [Candidatus Kentron sp. SD]VFK77839.1 MAG: NitT/TauT family transport system permease protein [Candidatus Kentron sp. SD]
MKGRFADLSMALARWGLVALFLASWEFGARIGFVDPFYFSAPSRIGHTLYLWAMEGILFRHLWVTLSEAGAGFLAGLFLGIGCGFLLAASPRLDAVLQPFIVILNAMPRIAFAPLIILWFGLGFLSKVVIVVSLVFFVVFFNTYRGFKEINPAILKSARVMGATPTQMLFHVYLPATLAWTFASIRVSVGFSIIAAVLGEYIGASAGIGYLIDNAQANFDSTGVMAGLVTLTISVAILDGLLQAIERRYAVRQSA